MKNKSIKLPFVTKNSTHLVGTTDDDDDLLALIEFTPLSEKQQRQITLDNN